MDRSEISLLTLIDLSRCFDVIDHGMLLSKLEFLCISTGWFRSYLSDHEQRVRKGGNCPNRFRSRLAAFRAHAWDRFYTTSHQMTYHVIYLGRSYICFLYDLLTQFLLKFGTLIYFLYEFSATGHDHI